tara:strand:+ start:530 stop:1489 length:960 start_codon:yes stop_codon:yes gene_type:complete
MRILVTGGAGYIGSHTCHVLTNKGYEVIVYDNLENGHKESLPENVKLIVGDLADTSKLNDCFKEKVDGVIHFAGYIEAGESMIDPLKFYKNNISNGINLLKVMSKNNVKNLVYSSSAGVYGQPKEIPIKEISEKKPVNNYGWTKLMFEQIVDSCDFNCICLRYFNAAGAGFNVGEDHDPETHLIPLILGNVLGKNEFKIFGEDYKTPDKSCIRDYIHVLDLAEVHLVALEALFKGIKGKYNVGTGKGNSVFEIINVCEEVTGKKIVKNVVGRREGDPAELVADADKIFKELGWKAKYDLKEIIRSAWEWHKNNPGGFKR